jgi:hypothetical protein
MVGRSTRSLSPALRGFNQNCLVPGHRLVDEPSQQPTIEKELKTKKNHVGCYNVRYYFAMASS